jgi:hypothetical protein
MVSLVPMLAVVAILVLTSGGGLAAPSLAQAASLAGRGPTGPAPRASVSIPGVLVANVQGLHFPNLSRGHGWSATGIRTDRLDGHTVLTVYYRHAADEVAYSIVETPRWPWTPSNGYQATTTGNRTIVTWTEAGHTCILSGPRGTASTLRRLAAASD